MTKVSSHKIIKITAWVIGIAIGLPLLIAMMLYIPPVQRLAVDIASRYIAESTGMKIDVGYLRLKFPLNLSVDDVLVIENTGDTMVTAGNAELRIAMLPLLRGDISLEGFSARSVFYQLGNSDSVIWLRAHIDKADIDNGNMNFSRGSIDVGNTFVDGGCVTLIMKDTTVVAPTDTTAMQPLAIRAQKIRLANIDYRMCMPPIIDTLTAHIGDAILESGVVDTGSRRINASRLSVSGVNATYLTAPMPAQDPVTDSIPPLPDDEMWVITADSVKLQADNAVYATTGAHPLPGLDFNYLQAQDVEIAVTDFYNKGTAIRVPLQRLKATERCGLELSAAGTFSMNGQTMEASGFHISTQRSDIKLDATMGIGDLTSDPDLPLGINLTGILSANDAAMAFPAYAPMIKSLPQPRDFNVRMDANGTTSRLKVDNVKIQLPRVFNLSANGEVKNITDFDKMGGRIEFDGAVTNPKAVNATLASLKMDSTITIPSLKLNGSANYNPGNVSGNLKLVTGSGKLLADGRWVARKESYQADIGLKTFPIDAFMPSLGIKEISAAIHVTGTGYNPLSPATTLLADVSIDDVVYNGSTYTDASLTAEARDGDLKAFLISNNPDARIELNAHAQIDSGIIKGELNGEIQNLDLLALGVMSSPCRGRTDIAVKGQYDPRTEDIQADVNISDFDWLMDTVNYYIPSLTLHATADKQVTAVDILSEDLMLRSIMKTKWDSIMPVIDRVTQVIDNQIANKRADVTRLQQTIPPLDIDLSMGPGNIAGRILAQSGIAFDNMSLTMRNDSLLHLNGGISRLTMGTNVVDSVALHINQHNKYLVYNVKMTNGPGPMAEWADVTVNGFIADDKLALFVDQHNLQGQQGYRLGTVSTLTDSVLTVKLVPRVPVIAYKNWRLNSDNFLSYNIYNKHIEADILLENLPSSLHVFTRPVPNPEEGSSANELVVSAKEIKIEDWIGFSPFAPPMSGVGSANLKIHRVNDEVVGTLVVGLDNFMYNRQKVGKFGLALKVAENPKIKSLWADGILWVNDKKTIVLSGALNDSTRKSPFLLDMSMIHFPLNVANPFLPVGTAKLGGSLNGTMKLSGSATKPVVDGYLQFDSASVMVDMIGATYRFSDTKIPVDSNIVRFDNFAINTLNDNPLTINGTADISNLDDVRLKLHLEGNDMLMVNSNRPKGADIYGKGYIGINADVSGSMSDLYCNADVSLLSGSDVTYVMTSSQAALTSQSTDDMVSFVNFADTTQISEDSKQAQTSNMTLNATLRVMPNATVNVDISTDGKNHASIIGQGELTYTMSPQNSGRVIGRYTINEGEVKYTPPLMSEKDFKFKEGSYVNFTGDMMNPGLNISATDRMKANVSPEGGNSRLVYFNVTINVTGSLDNMKVEFDLSCDDDITIQNELSAMSPEQRANQAMNLLLYGVYTGPGTKANAGLSGNPLYSFLASQLNTLASNIKFVDISFGIDQYSSTIQGNTSTATNYSYQISKNLLNNRIRIVVGGSYTTDPQADENFAENLVNNISFEYLLNRSGSMYVKLFRHTGYEIVEGEIISTGVGFVYKRNLNSLRHMFKFGRPNKQQTPPPDTTTADIPSIDTAPTTKEQDTTSAHPNDEKQEK